jgi:hypothetical protein
LYSEFLTKEIYERFGGLKIREKVVRTMKYADDLGILTEKLTVLQGIVNWITELGSC